jgi:CRP/FNR family cyclic AMP-dependent transcriptional regulator
MAESKVSADVLDSLRQVPLFSGVGEDDLENIAALLIERRYPKNSIIVEEGLTGDYMYIIRSGRVKVTKASDDGREKIMDFLEAGAFFGEMALLDHAPRSASVRTLAPSVLAAISRRDFLDLLRGSPGLGLSLIQELTRRLRDTDDQATSVSFQRVEDRAKGLFARIARREAGSADRRITPALTHQQIADMIGTSRETVTRAVKELKQSGWLEQQGKRYLVP